MKLLLALFLALLLGPGGLTFANTDYSAYRLPAAAAQQQPPTPEPSAPPQRASLAVALALACICNLSVIALLGSIALRRRIDRISPDR